MIETDLKRGRTKTILHVCGFNNFNDNFKDNFVPQKVNKTASKAKTLNICALKPN